MFEIAELGNSIDKKTYKEEVPLLREQLLDIQYELAEKKSFPVVVIMSGVDGAGKGLMVNTLNNWMDPRHIHTHAMGAMTDEESERPDMWRYWRKLPPSGALGIYFGSWYSSPIFDAIEGKSKGAELDSRIDEILRFERMLVDEGALVLKFWLHLSRKDLKRRLKTLESNKETKWRVNKYDWNRYKTYNEFRSVSEHLVRRTSTGHAPWLVIESGDDNYRDLTVGRALLRAIQGRLNQEDAPGASPHSAHAKALGEVIHRDVLGSLNYTKVLEKKNYKRQLAKYQARLSKLCRDPKFHDKALVLLFEGNDAAGKGGSIRRVVGAMDARFYDIVPVAAPTDEERAHPYLWRFWRHLPRKGHTTIFDRSWYGRVLVERVEGYCSEADWLRAYGEINDFEEEMAHHGTIVCKFWLAITADEQLDRFKEREATGYKRFKLTEEDWRNRDKWGDYSKAVNDMVERTSSETAPWTLVPANSKYAARIQVIKTICQRLEKTLGIKA